MLRMIECLSLGMAVKQQWWFSLYFVLGLIKVSSIPDEAELISRDDDSNIQNCSVLAAIKVSRFVGNATFIADFFGGDTVARYRLGHTRYYVIGDK